MTQWLVAFEKSVSSLSLQNPLAYTPAVTSLLERTVYNQELFSADGVSLFSFCQNVNRSESPPVPSAENAVRSSSPPIPTLQKKVVETQRSASPPIPTMQNKIRSDSPPIPSLQNKVRFIDMLVS